MDSAPAEYQDTVVIGSDPGALRVIHAPARASFSAWLLDRADPRYLSVTDESITVCGVRYAIVGRGGDQVWADKVEAAGG